MGKLYMNKIIKVLKRWWKNDQLTRLKRKQAFFQRRDLIDLIEINDGLMRRIELEIEELERQ